MRTATSSHILAALAAAGAVCQTGRIATADTILEGWQSFSAVEANDPQGGRSTVYDSDGGFGGAPISSFLHAEKGGGVSDTLVEFDNLGARSNWNHSMDPGHDDAEPRTAFIFEFQVDHDSTYALSGSYVAYGYSRMSAIIKLWDRDTGQSLFWQQIDGWTDDPFLYVGLNPPWAGYAAHTGSLTGLLEAGTRYRLDLDVFLRQGDGGPGVQGSGDFNLHIVPAPGSLLLLGLGGALASRGLIRRNTPFDCLSGCLVTVLNSRRFHSGRLHSVETT